MDGSMNPDVIVAVIFAGVLAVGLAVAAAISALGSPDRRLEQRLSGLQNRWSKSVKPQSTISVKRLTNTGGGHRFDRLLHSLVPRPEELRKRLAQTGLNITLSRYVIANLTTIAVATCAFSFGFGFSGVLSVLAGISVGLGLPHLVLGKLIARRLNQFTALFPDAIDLIVRGLRSGLPITETLGTVAEEIENPVGLEFQRTVDAIKLGRNPDDALLDTAERLDTAEFRFFVISLSIQRETGGNLAETLEKLSDVLRRRRQMKLKIKAMSSEARASALIIGSLPFIMMGILLLINYDYVAVLFSDPRAMLMMGVGLSLMAIGGGVISKMVKFEI